ncbi:MAG: hypothetical protein IT378_05335 [Sandaracinaceae bacterium]|nr:hypothetical protein [Sandaracinaceae bacterium]
MHAFRVDGTSGALTPVAGSPFALPTRVCGLAAHPRADTLYVAEGGTAAANGTVHVMSVDPATGALTEAGTGNAVGVRAATVLIAVEPQ